MKIYLSKINESWIVDRFREDWYKHNKDISSKQIYKADTVWIISPWVWKKIPKRYLKKKNVVCSIYHIDFDSFNNEEKKDFQDRDKYVDFYHVISKNTKKQLEKITDKKIISIPFWVDSDLWFPIEQKNKLRDELGFDEGEYLIGSFQRDTEGFDLESPKLIKGPDIFLQIIEQLYSKNKNLKVVLAGNRRNYLIKNFESKGIPYEYFEMADLETLNKLYNILDLYLVTSRVEGGPQAILECSITKTPIVSTNVGVAPEILHPESIFSTQNFSIAKPNIEYAFQNAQEFIIPRGMKEYRKMFMDNYEN